MKDSVHDCTTSNKRPRNISETAFVYVDHLDIPLISTTTSCDCLRIGLQPDSPYTVGRNRRYCEFVFEDRRVSKRHCQILFDGLRRKLCILDGTIFLNPNTNHCTVHEFRKLEKETDGKSCSGRVRASLNGVFVNGVRIGRGSVAELAAGDEVLLVCSSRIRVGFVVQRIVFKEGVVQESNAILLQRSQFLGTMISSSKVKKRVFALRENDLPLFGPDSATKCVADVVRRADFLLSQCRHILNSDDPISYIRQYDISDSGITGTYTCSTRKPEVDSVVPVLPLPLENSHIDRNVGKKRASMVPPSSIILHSGNVQPLDPNQDLACKQDNNVSSGHAIANVNPKEPSLISVGKGNAPNLDGGTQNKGWGNSCSPPGRGFYLNRLENVKYGSSSHHRVISLPELIYPVESISRIFIATFTSDILWFLSYCKIPPDLPVTVACHNTEKCWSSSPDKRTSMPFPDFPNLVEVYPPFPVDIAFGKDLKKKGIACHHPKLLVLQREDSIRVIITSANLVAKQWNSVTNTIWWQDFPCTSAPNYLSLFTQIPNEEINRDSRSDFAAQLAGFMASLVIDVPSQAHWIVELTKYDFGGAQGHLISSVPGIHSDRTPYISEPMQFLPYASWSVGMKFLGSVEASVVGLSHLFRTAADSNGAQLKKLAAFFGKSCENAIGMVEIILRRNTNVPADANAVSVHVPNPDEMFEGGCIQLGFLPRHVAKWVSPLWDVGFFRFSACVCRKEALAAAAGENDKKVQLILHVSQGPRFPDISKMMQHGHVIAFCSLIASIRRCTGIWRLQEVLDQYKWPELLESDFIYSSSSIGSSINAQFRAAFTAAAGKRSLQVFDSEESDPEWGCWNASQESKTPSVRIIFPTIERVKSACNGIWPSKRILCFSEKTWQRVRTLDILHDAIPHPHDRVGHPMHVKVMRRRFQSRMDASSFGWVYCGSHNFSAAAWGRPLSNPFSTKTNGLKKANSSFGLRLHICNYELGIIFIFPATDKSSSPGENSTNLDDIVLPFVVPAPKYKPTDRPATAQAMREALSELAKEEMEKLEEDGTREEMEEMSDEDEEEVLEATDCVAQEKEEGEAYAEILWSQVDSSLSC